MKKEIRNLFLIIILYGLACGLSQNFQELWLIQNNLTTTSVSNVYSLCALITVSVIFLCTNVIKKEHLKIFSTFLLFLRIIMMFFLFFLNGSGHLFLIKFITILDYSIDVEFFASVYPLIAYQSKNNKYYAYKDIIYQGFFYLAVLVSTILLGKSIGGISISYNSYFLVTTIILAIAFFILKNTDIKIKSDKKESDINVFPLLMEKLKEDKVSNNYLIFLVSGQISNNIVLGLTMTLLTAGLMLEDKTASLIILVAGILSAIFGMLLAIKKKDTAPKKAMFIKYVIRFILYIFAFITMNRYIIIFAVMYPKLVSVVYTHITDAPYVNRYPDDLQFAFCNFKEMLTYLSKAIGVFLCGISLKYGIIYVFLLAALFTLIQVIFAYRSLRLRNEEK